MKSPVFKKILKFLVAAVILGIVTFFGIKLLFPQPDRLDVYNRTFSISQNENYILLTNTSRKFLILMNNRQEDALLNQLTFAKLKIADTTLTTLHSANNYTLSITAYAKNTSIYDSNAKVIDSLYKKINSKYDEIKNYITTYVDSFLEPTVEKSISSINSYSNAILEYEISLNNLYMDYNNALANIISNQEKSITNNDWSIALFRIQNAFAKIQVDTLNSNVSAEILNSRINNVELYSTFTLDKLTTEYSQQYYSNHNDTYAMLVNINSIVDMHSLLLNILTEEESSYLSSIENTTLQATTNQVIAFIKGV